MNTEVRLPAEWEAHSFTQITWPSVDSDWEAILPEVEACYVGIVRAVTAFEPLLIVADDPDHVAELLSDELGERIMDFVTVYACPVNDTWARDHGFITTLLRDGSPVLTDFQFNGWGMKFAAYYDNMINQCLHEDLFPEVGYRDARRIVLEGGSIESDGRGTVMTTEECLFAPNRNYFSSREEAEGVLCRFLGAKRVLWIENGYLQGDDTDSHVDTLARFAPHDSIVYVLCADPSDEHYEDLKEMERQIADFRTLDGEPYRMVALPMVTPIYDPDDEEQRLPATYANFYFVNGAILVPVYGVATDEVALGVMAEAFPEYPIVPVASRVLIRQHGSLHCSTMQFPVGIDRSFIENNVIID